MNTINKAKVFAAAAILGLSLPSCNDWLDVEMEDKVMENTLFSNYDGYMAALNGVYLSMNNTYTSTMPSFDVMAQYYNVSSANNHRLQLYASYSYSDVNFESANTTFWNNMYTLLANDNVIIERTEGDAPLTNQQRAIIRGEALALRAFLHFDLLRVYGPVFSENPTAISIPYQNNSFREITPILPANEVLDLIIADLREAESLLAQYDPIITEGAKNEAIDDDGVSSYDLAFRQLRFNYYAVEAMLARAYHWKGDKATAYDIAKHNIIDKVSTESLVVFPWTTRSAVTAEGKPDYMFSSEVIFSLYNSLRSNTLQASYYSSSLTAKSSRITFFGEAMTGNSKVASFYDDDNDLRKLMWEVVEPTDEEKKAAEESWWAPAATNSLALNKFKDFDQNTTATTTDLHRYMIPLIRLSEVYLIAAECASTESEGRELINTIRVNRDCHSLLATDEFQSSLTYEMAREVIGEGQLFFFYKRRGDTQLIGGTSNTPFNMISSNYVWPIPQAEMDKRVTVGN